jgi:hypothetical protein
LATRVEQPQFDQTSQTPVGADEAVVPDRIGSGIGQVADQKENI